MTTRDPEVQALLDREAIRACLYRYCRGIDRCDLATLKSVYWPEAVDNHVHFNGNAWEFAEWVVPLLKSREQTMHSIVNVMIELDGNNAAVESQYIAYERVSSAKRGVSDLHVGGRYLDGFEKRGNEWRVLHRDVNWSWFSANDKASDWSKGIFGKPVPFGAKYPEDWLYSRLGVKAGAKG